jgi:hypothetical protein
VRNIEKTPELLKTEKSYFREGYEKKDSFGAVCGFAWVLFGRR